MSRWESGKVSRWAGEQVGRWEQGVESREQGVESRERGSSNGAERKSVIRKID